MVHHYRLQMATGGGDKRGKCPEGRIPRKLPLPSQDGQRGPTCSQRGGRRGALSPGEPLPPGPSRAQERAARGRGPPAGAGPRGRDPSPRAHSRPRGTADANPGVFFPPECIFLGLHLYFLIAGVFEAKRPHPRRVGEEQSPDIRARNKSPPERAAGRAAGAGRNGPRREKRHLPLGGSGSRSGSRSGSGCGAGLHRPDLLSDPPGPQSREAAGGAIIANLWPG